MHQYWLYMTATLPPAKLSKLFEAFRMMHSRAVVPIESKVLEISIESLCLISRTLPTMLLISKASLEGEGIYARADILERVICTTWGVHPRLC